MADIKFNIMEQYGILSNSRSGWTKELNLVSWNDGAPKLDLRESGPDHTKMGKGITLTEKEAATLIQLLIKIGFNVKP